MTRFSSLLCALPLLALASCADKAPRNASPTVTVATAPATIRAKSHAGARVFIVEPANGATVTNPVTVKFGAEGIEVAKVVEGIKDNSGHHHLLIDLDQLPPINQALPSNEHVLHFGQGQTETSINLTPGTHTLQLILAGGNHIPHDPPVISEKITVVVPTSESSPNP